MKNPALPILHTWRRGIGIVPALLTTCLDSFTARFAGWFAVTGAMPAQYPPERQDLYGFAASDIVVSGTDTS